MRSRPLVAFRARAFGAWAARGLRRERIFGLCLRETFVIRVVGDEQLPAVPSRKNGDLAVRQSCWVGGFIPAFARCCFCNAVSLLVLTSPIDRTSLT